MDWRLGAVEMAHELLDAAAVAKFVALLRRLLLDDDAHAAIEERQLAQALRENIEAEVGALEDRRIGGEADLSAGLRRGADLGQRRVWLAALIALCVDLAAA